MFKIELENRDFRKSLYFYIVDAEKKKKKKNGLRLGAGIILNQELTYSRRWGGNGMRALASALIYVYMSIRLYTKIREFQDLTVERP